MINFAELPQDGNALEQLVRELLMIEGLSVHWTGKGPDQGRDLIAEEIATGPLGTFRRRWLVQCKHTAHSGRSVGRDDLPSILDDCRQISADGYLLVCSTQPSSSLVSKLSELAADPQNRLVTAFWDSVILEKRLTEARGFSLAHIFFPASMKGMPWKFYNAGSPSSWAAHYKDYFVYIHSRNVSGFPDLYFLETILEIVSGVQVQTYEYLRPRAIYFDDQHTDFCVFADYIVNKHDEPSLDPEQLVDQLYKSEERISSKVQLKEGEIQGSVGATLKVGRFFENVHSDDSFWPDNAYFYAPHADNFLGIFYQYPRSSAYLVVNLNIPTAD